MRKWCKNRIQLQGAAKRYVCALPVATRQTNIRIAGGRQKPLRTWTELDTGRRTVVVIVFNQMPNSISQLLLCPSCARFHAYVGLWNCPIAFMRIGRSWYSQMHHTLVRRVIWGFAISVRWVWIVVAIWGFWCSFSFRMFVIGFYTLRLEKLRWILCIGLCQIIYFLSQFWPGCL